MTRILRWRRVSFYSKNKPQDRTCGCVKSDYQTNGIRHAGQTRTPLPSGDSMPAVLQW